MRILYLGNNWVAWQVLEWLKAEGAEVVGLVIHPPHKQKHTAEMLKAANLSSDRLIDGSQLHAPEVMRKIKELAPDIGISVLFDYIIRPDLLHLFPHGIVNLHPSYLPFNRGQYPNVWSIIERTPCGTTLHYIDEQIDTGDIIAQKEVPIEPIDTGETLYRKLEAASVQLFKDTWPLLQSGKASRVPQNRPAGTYHRARDVETIDRIELEQTYRARDLIDILRARTFPPHRGAYFEVNGRRVYLQLHLEHDEKG
jgi:methionyl-tRNA formyltransferase